MRFCKVLLCSAALALLAVSVESSSGGSTGTHSYDLSGQDLRDLYNKRVYQAEKVERRLGSSSSPFWPFSHTGVRVTLDDGSKWLVHKGDNYGITSQTVVTDARHMSSNWETTGLVGLAVSQNPHERLRILYSKILASLQSMPQDAAYRKYTEQLVTQRFDHVKTEPDVEKLEKKINGGQIEEVIFQAECELALSRKMADWKPWEPLVEEAPPNQWKWPV